jgi:DNA-binding CsgD family transcriptional regulator
MKTQQRHLQFHNRVKDELRIEKEYYEGILIGESIIDFLIEACPRRIKLTRYDYYSCFEFLQNWHQLKSNHGRKLIIYETLSYSEEEITFLKTQIKTARDKDSSIKICYYNFVNQINPNELKLLSNDDIIINQEVLYGQSLLGLNKQLRELLFQHPKIKISSPTRLRDMIKLEKLTMREIEILNLIVQGLSNADIGEELNISANTVKNHITSLLAKFHCLNRTQLVSLAFRIGLVN